MSLPRFLIFLNGLRSAWGMTFYFSTLKTSPNFPHTRKTYDKQNFFTNNWISDAHHREAFCFAPSNNQQPTLFCIIEIIFNFGWKNWPTTFLTIFLNFFSSLPTVLSAWQRIWDAEQCKSVTQDWGDELVPWVTVTEFRSHQRVSEAHGCRKTLGKL